MAERKLSLLTDHVELLRAIERAISRMMDAITASADREAMGFAKGLNPS